jgi:hypothetical protein
MFSATGHFLKNITVAQYIGILDAETLDSITPFIPKKSLYFLVIANSLLLLNKFNRFLFAII